MTQISLKDMVNKKFNKLLVLERVENNKHNQVMFKCKCDCGNEHITSKYYITSGHTTSCGCQKLIGKNYNTKSKTYSSWISMKQRCLNPNSTKYPKYGARGITICNRWLNSFENFLEDMGERLDNTTIDRIDNNGNYEPLNCRWASPSTQGFNRNTQSNSPYKIHGVGFHKKTNKWRAYIKINNKNKHLGLFTSFFDAVCARKSAENTYIL